MIFHFITLLLNLSIQNPFTFFFKDSILCSILNQLLHILLQVTFLRAFHCFGVSRCLLLFKPRPHAFYAFIIPNMFSNSVLLSPQSHLSSHFFFFFRIFFLGGLSLSDPFFTGCKTCFTAITLGLYIVILCCIHYFLDPMASSFFISIPN